MKITILDSERQILLVSTPSLKNELIRDISDVKAPADAIAVKEGNENNEKIKALVEVLKSDAIKEYINSTYDGSVIPFE